MFSNDEFNSKRRVRRVCKKSMVLTEALVLLLSVIASLISGLVLKGENANESQLFLPALLNVNIILIVSLIFLNLVIILLAALKEQFFIKLRWLCLLVAYLNISTILSCLIVTPGNCDMFCYIALIAGLASRYATHLLDNIFN
jgi:hypothetical protein